jgi:hypothetical protein
VRSLFPNSANLTVILLKTRPGKNSSLRVRGIAEVRIQDSGFRIQEYDPCISKVSAIINVLTALATAIF